MSFAVIYLPLIMEFGGSRAEVATVQSAVFLVGGISGPLIGWVFDRLGPRRLVQAGALVAAAALAVASRVDSLFALVVIYGVIGGLGLAAFGSQANMSIAALWYPRARGRAIAVADLGTGFGAFCFLPLAQALVTALGWRSTLLAWAALLIAIVVPLNVFQRLPDGVTVHHRSADASARGWTLRTALRSAPFWWLVVMRFAAACAFPLMNVHMVAYAIGQGIHPATAATALGTVSLVSLVGRLTTGWLCDHLGRAPTLTVTYSSAALGIGGLALLAFTSWPGWLVFYVVLYGMAQGSSGIVGSARVADVFAGAAFGAIYGWMTLAVGPGEALGAWLGGKIFDATGSYLGAFAVAVTALVIGVVAMWRVRADPLRS
jgi:MFS family permease